MNGTSSPGMNGTWNPWKVTAVAMALVMSIALVTGLVVANRAGHDTYEKTAALSPGAANAPAARLGQTSRVPTQAAVDACNRHASSQTGARDKTAEVVKDAAVGAIVGAAVGAAGGAIAGGGKGAGKGAAIGGVVGAGGGTLYGLNENKKHDERYRDAYAGCMRSRGYSG
jgi:hypothetical protein